MEGRIIGLNCGYYSVLSDGMIFKVKARGAFRNKSIKPVVGDKVELDDTYFVIISVYPRETYLKRPVIANLSDVDYSIVSGTAVLLFIDIQIFDIR